MATDCQESPGKTKRRRIETDRRKLTVHEKVEVRRLEDGFLGSWHTATVIFCEDLSRLVQYDHILSDDGSSQLIESVKVTPLFDGVVAGETWRPINRRGTIRPLPPSCVLEPQHLHYGQLVDCFYEDAWWEGVIFDYKNGGENRNVFFPDMGDEVDAQINMLRISQEWDEVTDEWKSRGNWLFLEILEELERDWPLPVSIKQIWYELRVKSSFRELKDWNSSTRSIWRNLVFDVWSDNFKISFMHLSKELSSAWDSTVLGVSLLEFSGSVLDSILQSEGLFDNPPADVPFKATCHYQQVEQNDAFNSRLMKTLTTSGQPLSLSQALPTLSNNPGEVSQTGYRDSNDGVPSMGVRLSNDESMHGKSLERRPSVPDFVPEANYCPSAIFEAIKMYKLKNKVTSQVSLNARKDLLHLGWKIEFVQGDNNVKLQYLSPDGKRFSSLRKICLLFDCRDQELAMPCQLNPLSPNGPRKVPSPLIQKPPDSSKLPTLCTSSLAVIKPEYCPESVNDYYNKYSSGGRGKNMKFDSLKAKRHLSATGWSFSYTYRQNRWLMRFRSPTGRAFYTLLSACKWCLQVRNQDDCGIVQGEMGDVSPEDDCRPTLGETGNVSSQEDDCTPGIVDIEPEYCPESVNDYYNKHSSCDHGKNCELDALKAKRHLSATGWSFGYMYRQDRWKMRFRSPTGRVFFSLLSACEWCLHHKVFRSGTSRTPSGSTKVREVLNAVYSNPFQSNRRTTEVAESSSQTSKNILSWLIDNNVVLPRSKVKCQGNKGGHPVQQGRITREGIKCDCCHKSFSLSSFQRHAGLTNSIPAANICLQDGRSLLDCQAQLNRKMSSGNSRSESCQKMTESQQSRTNDNVCAICRYGGELVLCDQCPSSFHTHCLGLKEVPSGDWFCPLCCCKICGQGASDEKSESLIETSSLICNQCERKYHVGCVKIEGVTDLERYPEGFWFCGDTCEQIYCGLRKSLGTPVSLGTGNLSWTLVKFIKPDSYDHGTFAAEYLIESHSKLNIALWLMHECFEPIEEPGSTTDLVEDVIFSRSSEMKRLNFQGFYTVLLEKDDELITVATVRIYGNRVAEIPLVATCVQYRRLGMCHILMNELEKKLMELGVERLVLPAVPSVLDTWTKSFGFSVMNESDRLSLLDYTFLCFQGTVICQKLLTVASSSGSTLSTEAFKNKDHHVTENGHSELDCYSVVAEVLHTDQVVASADGTEDNNGNGHLQVD